MRRVVLLLPVLALAACFPPVELPPPPEPTHELPPVAAHLPPVPPGRQLVILDTPGDTATVAAYAGTALGYDADGNAVTTQVTRELCTTPCVHDFRPGPHTLAFTSTTVPDRADTLDIQLGAAPLVVRHVPEDNSGQWGWFPELFLGLMGAAILPMGGAFTAAGASSKDDAVFEDTGIILLAAGVTSAALGVVLGYEGRGEHRPGATTEWTLPAQPAAAPVPDVSTVAPSSPSLVAPPPPSTDLTARLRELDDLHARKVITDEEYQRERQRILNQGLAPSN